MYMSKTFTGEEGSRFSMRKTLDFDQHHKEQMQKPGPGNYSPSHKSIKKKESAWKIGSEVRKDLAFEKKNRFQVAPGQYSPMH